MPGACETVADDAAERAAQIRICAMATAEREARREELRQRRLSRTALSVEQVTDLIEKLDRALASEGVDASDPEELFSVLTGTHSGPLVAGTIEAANAAADRALPPVAAWTMPVSAPPSPVRRREAVMSHRSACVLRQTILRRGPNDDVSVHPEVVAA